MECKDIQEKLSDYLDGLLSDYERKQADEHLKSCPDCSHALEELKKTVAYTQGLEEVEPPPWLEQKVMAEVRDGERRKEGFLQRLLFPVNTRFPIELIATLAIAVTALFVFRSVEPDLEKISEKQVTVQGESDRVLSDYKADEEKERFLLDKDIKKLPKSAATAKRKMFRRIPVIRGEKESINVTVYVDNFKISADRIEEMIKELRGEIVKTERFKDNEVITIVVDSNKISKLINELKALWEIKEKEIPGEDFDGKVEMKIEFVKKH